MADFNKIIERIRSFQERTVERGFTEAEAIAAAKMVSKLMEEYQISESEINYKEQDFVEKKYTNKERNRNYMHSLFNAIGYFTDTKTYYNEYREQIDYKFFGSKNDVYIAQYLCDMLTKAISYQENLFKQDYLTRFKLRNRRNALLIVSDYRNGVCHNLAIRLREMKDERDKNIRNTPGIVLYNKMKIVEEQWLILFPGTKIHATNAEETLGSLGFQLGYIDGNKIDITQPVDTPAPKVINTIEGPKDTKK